MGTRAPRVWTVAEYLAHEATSPVRHEFYNGQLYAMAGATPRHAFLKENLSISIGTALRALGCRGAGSDLRVRVEETGFHACPDYLILCGQGQYASDDPNTLLDPVVLFEILSPSTERYDRVFKRDQYGRISSLRQYVLISPDEVRVESLVPTEVGWQLHSLTSRTDVLDLAVGIAIPLAAIYEGLEMETERPVFPDVR